MRYVAVISVLAATSLLVMAGGKAPKPEAVSVEQSVLIQIEKDWNQAIIAKDYQTVDKIMANDWVGIDFKGMKVTKEETLAELKSGESSNETVELGEMTVKVYGNTAVVIGSDTEKSTYHGKDSSGRYAWMDVFVKRAGQWQVVASQSTKIGELVAEAK